ncbi:DNA-binding transcriptional regulator, LysR family [Sporobacter termitidis DSM 10068]|uniref:DNA-binding transcriptional regulator, LysR family n=1 Tax=Sporobacter termitidis DSM 10068 TaxID=1123282 RepID=A0A1M5USK4_9FIRM|nr:LysR family transcriptional regulator [Sporobacter termitidis]SHH65961.1 DNA-binding transcriptional regulator, LysR family [Sporobacter termitidis DSM 10068]
MNVNLDYYRLLYYVAKYKNITQAAKFLMTSQPAVTRCLHCLEQELGCRLFIRSTKGVTLTPEGQILYSYIAPAYDLITQGENALAGAIGLENGSLYIGTSETALQELLLDALDKYHRLYPNVRLKISDSTNQEAITSLKNSHVDLAVVAATELEADKPLRKTRLKKFHDILIAGPQFAALREKTRSLRELEKYPLICLSPGTLTYDFIEQYYISNKLKLKPDIEVSSVNLMLSLVLHNQGLAFIPGHFAESALRSGQALQIDLAEPPPPRYIYLVENMSQPLSTAAKMLKLLLTSQDAGGQLSAS